MADQIRVNIKHRVNNASIKREKRNGRDVVVVPSAVAKFNTVLNDIFYGEQPLRESYEQINNLPAPLGHPVINGQYVSARMPEAINQFWSGAWNANARIEGDRVMADKIIDVEYAQNSENGRRLMQAIDQGEPISTSTGLLMDREPAPEGAGYKWVGTNFAFDHDAILLDEAPAISTEDGVGMMVNAAGEEMPVVQSELAMDDDILTMMAWEMVERNEYDEKKKRNAGMVERIKNIFKTAFTQAQYEQEEATGLNVNTDTANEDRHMTPEELQAALDKQAETLTASFNAKLVEAVKPINDTIAAMNQDREAAAAAEKTQLEETVVNAKLMTAEEAQALDVNALKIMARNAAPGKKTAGIASGMAANGAEQDSWADYDLNANMEAK